LNYIIIYENFNESKGISDSCEKVLYKIWNLIESDIIGLKDSYLRFDINESDFKCNDIVLKYQTSKGDDNLCNAITKFNSSKIINGYLTGLNINIDITFEELNDEFIYYIKSVLFHEILHIFQYYNLKINNKFRPESFSIGSIIPQLRNIIKSDYGNYILDVLYHSLSHELSAQIHQYYLYKINHKEYKKIHDIKKLLNDFVINKLSNSDINDLKFIQKHIIGSISYLTTNKKYLSDINKSIWGEQDINKFLEKFKNLLKYKVKWIETKMELIDKKIEDMNIIRYDEDVSLPHNWDMYDIEIRSSFIKKNLSDSTIVEFI
jgi:hypothetical protein